jgi:hypothetical protein
MPEANLPDAEARLRAEVDRAVAPYEGSAPPFVLARMRALAERYYRENPAAARALRLIDAAQRVHSGVDAISLEGSAEGPSDEEPQGGEHRAAAGAGRV